MCESGCKQSTLRMRPKMLFVEAVSWADSSRQGLLEMQGTSGLGKSMTCKYESLTLILCRELIHTHLRINNAFMKGTGRELRTQPSALKTPPYVTAKPEVQCYKFPLRPVRLHAVSQVEHRKVSFRAGTSSFCVLATDGLWDELR